jgi:hypothetical protein
MVRKIEAYSKAKDKNQLSRSLQMLMFWLNDVYSLKNGAGENQIVNSDDIATLKKFAGAFGDKNIPASIEEIEYGVSLIYRNININLSLMNIFLKLRQNFIA